MSPVHASVARVLLLLHAAAAAVLGGAMLNTTADVRRMINESTTEREATTSRPGEKTTAIPEGAVPPTVQLYCLENGRKVLFCDPGTPQAALTHWTLDGRDLEKTQAFLQNKNKTITLSSGVLGNISCTVRDESRSLTSLPITLACEGDTWLFYSTILSAVGGSAVLLSLITCAIAGCCRRRVGHHTVPQEDSELGPVFVEAQKKTKVNEVQEVEETTPITNKTTPNVKSADVGFQFPMPPDMADVRPEKDGRATVGEGPNASAAGSEDRADGRGDNATDNGSNSIHGN